MSQAHSLFIATLWARYYQGQGQGCVTSTVAQNPPLRRVPLNGDLMFCGCHLEFCNNFISEFVFCKWSPMHWGPGVSAHRSFCLSSPHHLPLPKMGSHLPVSLSFFYPRQGPGCREGMDAHQVRGRVPGPCDDPHAQGSIIFISEQ